jgi:3-mercaptopyruvate sulfurtransferase SseA
LKEVYSEVAEGNSQMGTGSPNARILRTIGIDGSKLIVLYDDPDNSPGPCTRIWYHYKDLMGYLELADVQSGLRSYAVPTYKIAEDRLDADKCMNEL